MTRDTTRAAARQDLVESYVRHLESGGADTPESFLAARGVADGDALEALRLAGLLEARVRDEPQAGALLGPYRLVRRLGAGGMATVYEALVEGRAGRLRAGERVALKLVHPRLFSRPGFFARFLQEADVGRRVQHRNVVRVLAADAVEHRGGTAHVLALEYVEGRTLCALQADLGVVPEVLLREIAVQIALGLAAIHAAGVVHRDLKPENVLIADDHVVRIMDLGVARVVDGTAPLTLEGEFVGSLAYAAPEQFGGEVGPAVDLYALGVTLYELATGANPFQRDDFAQVMAAHLRETPRRVDEVREELSPFLSEVLATLLAKQPGERFEGAQELASVLASGERSAWWSERERSVRKLSARLPRVPVQRQTKLHGREEELALLHAAWTRARDGDGNTVFLDGEAGIGKSRLVDAFLHEVAAPDVHVLYGSYPPTGGMGGLSDAVLGHFGASGLAESLAPYLTVTTTLVPAFAAAVGHGRAPDDAPSLSGDALHAVFVHLMRALAAERPLVWVVDDLHFASEDGRKIVLSLSRAVEGHRVLLLVTARPGVDEGELAHFSRLESFQRTRLRRLGARDVIELLREAFRSEALAERLGAKIAYKSDGVPFFVFEMIRGLREGQFITQLPDGTWVETRMIDQIEVPSAVRDLIEARLRDLDKDERAILDVGAVQGFEFDPDIVARVLGRPRIAVLQDLAAIERRSGVVKGEAGLSRFDHHQIQEVLYEAVPPDLRTAYHAEIAAALEARAGAAEKDPETLDGALCVDLCEHWLSGGEGVRAVRYLLPAQVHLSSRHLHARVAELTERALAAPDLVTGEARAKALLRLCGALDKLGRRTRQEECAREAERTAGEAGAEGLHGEAARALGRVLFRTSRPAEAATAYRRAQEIAIRIGDREGEAVATFGVGAVHGALGRLVEAREHHERDLAISRETGNRRGEARALGNLGNVLAVSGEPKRALEYFERELALCRAVGDHENEANANGCIGAALHMLGRLPEARAFVERHLALSREVGDREGEARATGNLGIALNTLGLLDEARERAATCLVLSREIRYRAGERNATNSLGNILHAMGRPAAAREQFEQCVALSREIGDRKGEAIALHNLGAVLREQDERERAREVLEASLQLSQGIGLRHEAAMTHRQLGSLRAKAGGAEEAARSLARARDLAREGDFAGVETLARCELALLPAGDPADALAAFEEHEAQLGPAECREARFLLWKATGDRTHIGEAKRLLDESVSRVDDETRTSMLTNLRLNREIVAAWSAHDGANDEN